MPHVVVKLMAGRSESVKRRLAEQLVKDVTTRRRSGDSWRQGAGRAARGAHDGGAEHTGTAAPRARGLPADDDRDDAGAGH